jgi:hypothetical protein
MSENKNTGKEEELPAICGDPEAARILGMHQDWVAFLEARGHLRFLGGRSPRQGRLNVSQTQSTESNNYAKPQQ